jgi:hypothetical protein
MENNRQANNRTTDPGSSVAKMKPRKLSFRCAAWSVSLIPAALSARLIKVVASRRKGQSTPVKKTTRAALSGPGFINFSKRVSVSLIPAMTISGIEAKMKYRFSWLLTTRVYHSPDRLALEFSTS